MKITIIIASFVLVVGALVTILLSITPKSEKELDWKKYFFISDANIGPYGESFALSSKISNITDKDIHNVEIFGVFRDKETGDPVNESVNVGTVGAKETVTFQIILQKEFDTPTIDTVKFDKP